MINQNIQLADIIENNPIKDLENILGDTSVLIDRAYLSLTRNKTIEQGQ